MSAPGTAILTSHDYGASDRPLLTETIGENFDRIAATHANREALVDRSTGRRWTYARLHHDVLALAHGLCLSFAFQSSKGQGIFMLIATVTQLLLSLMSAPTPDE